MITAQIQWHNATRFVIAEEAAGRRGALSAQREEVPLGCNLAVPGHIVGKPSAKTQLPSSQ